MQTQQQLDLGYVRSIVEEVLAKRFPSSPQRQKVKSRHDHMAFACPICGDSTKDNSKKRAKFFFKDMKMWCYHMGCAATLTQLAKGEDVFIDPDKKMEIMSYVAENSSYVKRSEDGFIINELDKLIPMSDFLAYMESPDSFIKGFKPIERGGKMYNYLVVERGLPEKRVMSEVYQGVVRITERWFEDVAVFLNKAGDNVIGLQTRNTKSGKLRHFRVHDFADLYSRVYPGRELDEVEAVPYNKLSVLFNVFNVDFDRPVTVFEGYLDSLLWPNSVGAAGTNTDLSIFLGDEVNSRFFFDNDDAGRHAALKMMTAGKSVFLWGKLLDELASRKSDYYRYREALGAIKDLNKLATVSGLSNPRESLSMDKYFSVDRLDAMWVEKQPFVSRRKRAEAEKEQAKNEPHDVATLEQKLQEAHI